jgi:flagellar biosynthesis protein FlhF
MSVKRFVAADMRRALELVRQEMGPDAVILSSRRIKKGVEILTSMEPPSARPVSHSPADTNIDGVDTPMGSDGSWREQLAVEDAVQASPHHFADNPQAITADALNYSERSSKAQSISTTAAGGLGLASGKTADELAAEMECARDRMLAAKRVQSAADDPIVNTRNVKARAQNTAFNKPEFSERNESNAASVHQFSTRGSMQSSSDFSRPIEERAAAYGADAVKQQNTLDELQSEMADMRLLLEQQLSKLSDAPKFDNPLQSSLMRRLQQMGISVELAQSVVAEVRSRSNLAQAWNEALALLARNVPARSVDAVMNGGVFAFVGPTGVGKTTTIAKLAARYVLANGAQNVTLVTTDTYRIAAQEQLRSLGRILGVQVKTVGDDQDLPSVLHSLKGCPLVLIDTAGYRNGDSKLKQQLENIQAIPNVQTMLVMASNSQYQTLKATIHAHKPNKLTGCVLTKLDETASLGESLSVITEHNLPIFYTTDGQEIPQDIALARGHNLITKTVSIFKEGQAQTTAVNDS